MYCQVQSTVVNTGYVEDEKAEEGGRIKSCEVCTSALSDKGRTW
jgi:hypothetical protein